MTQSQTTSAPKVPIGFAPYLRIEGRASISGIPLFRDMALQVNAGEWTCLLGASGIGKSSLLKLATDQAQHIDFIGHCSVSLPHQLPSCCTLMAQDDLLLPWLSVRDNILIGPKLRGAPLNQQRADDLLSQVGLKDMEQRKPSALSGGQRQRAALARTLMEDRDVVLLDEPFSALDALTRSNMQELTAKLLKGKTVLLITHDPSEAVRLSHHIFIMTQDGLTPFDIPQTLPPRAVDDPDALKSQGALLAQLKGAL